MAEPPAQLPTPNASGSRTATLHDVEISGTHIGDAVISRIQRRHQPSGAALHQATRRLEAQPHAEERPEAKIAARVMSNTSAQEEAPRPPLPPFTYESAVKKVRMAEDAWNSRDPDRIALAYSPDTKWRNRNIFLQGREEVRQFLKGKWAREQEYRLIKEIWAHTEERIAVRFVYEYRDDSNNWFRAHGNENWHFDEKGLMRYRHASINDQQILESERLFKWPQGRRPDDHPGLTELGL
eukprot:6174410-Pleurochrysis_carterae.AAC.2